MAATDWRQHTTEEAQQALANAQYRLDNLNFGEEGYTPEQAEADKKLTDRYDALVLGPAQDEFERRREADEFNRLYPEPADGGRIEFEYGDGWHAAYRQDQAEGNGDWWLYGENGDCYSWRRLIGEFELGPDDITYLIKSGPVTAIEWTTRIHYVDDRPPADGQPMDQRMAQMAADGLNMAENADFRARKGMDRSEVVRREVRQLPDGSTLLGPWHSVLVDKRARQAAGEKE